MLKRGRIVPSKPSSLFPRGRRARTTGFLGLAIISLLWLAPREAAAQTSNWNGSDGNWNSFSNWSLNLLPTSSHDLRFSTSAFTNVSINGFGGFANSITFLTGANAFTIGGSQSLAVANITNSSSNLQSFSVSTISITGNADWSANTGAFSFSSAVNLGNNELTLKSSGAQASDISGLISGSGKVKVQSGVWTLSNGANSYTGATEISGGTLAVTANGALGNISGGTSISGGGTLDFRGVTYSAAQPVSSSSSNIAASVGTSSFAGPISLSGGSDALTVNVSSGVLLTLSGVISGGGGDKLTKIGTGHLTLSGSSANTYSGDTLINAGKLVLAKTAGLDAIAGGVVFVNTGGILELGASNQIASGVDMRLNGGTFELANFSETLGKLDLTASGGTINFGGTASALVFAKSSGENWDGGLLAITSYTTASNSLRFGTDNTGLSSTQLASIVFEGISVGAQIDVNGFVTPVPEPATYAAIIGAIALALAGYRRRRA
ncbi:MAG: autotransporter-associated beta strand repeat-containing protein [Opitutaceae bacterium]|nr:autotransporter-associated beta strand repeat-containing protein [Opitutaceae bacterium]